MEASLSNKDLGRPEIYPTLVDIEDPLEIAAKALAKLQANGLSGYVPPTLSVDAIQEDKVMLSEDTPAPQVDNLGEYRAQRRQQVMRRKPERSSAPVPTIDRRKLNLEGRLYVLPVGQRIWSKKVLTEQDHVAMYCKEVVVAHKDGKGRTDDTFERAFNWLMLGVEPLIVRICARYQTNSRISQNDLRQTIYEHTLNGVLPNYDSSKGHFFAYFGSTAWSRVDEVINKNVSQMSTVHSFLRKDNDDPDKMRALSAGSYDVPHKGVDFEENDIRDTVPSLEPSVGDEVAGSFLAKEILKIVQKSTAIEQAAYHDIIINGEGYAAVGARLGVDQKAMDNACMRIKKKIRKYLVDEGYLSE